MSVYDDIANAGIIPHLYYASTLLMMERMLGADPSVLLLVSRLGEDREKEEQCAALLEDCTSALGLYVEDKIRHPDEMSLVVALHILRQVSPGRAYELARQLLGHPEAKLGWARRMAQVAVTDAPRVLFTSPFFEPPSKGALPFSNDAYSLMDEMYGIHAPTKGRIVKLRPALEDTPVESNG